MTLDQIIENAVRAALSAADGNQRGAAVRLGVSRWTVSRYVNKYHIDWRAMKKAATERAVAEPVEQQTTTVEIEEKGGEQECASSLK